MSKNTLHSKNKLIKVLFSLPDGTPITSRYLDRLEISRQLAHQYVKSGWLERLGYGYYKRPGDEITGAGAAAALEMQGIAVHLGGKTALSLHGYIHYLALKDEILYLYAADINKLPEWLLKQFRCELRLSRLFDESTELHKRLYLKKMGDSAYSPFVSEPERALLEMLDDVPHRQSIDESQKIMEPLYNLRPNVINALLKKCRRVKVKRLFVTLAEKLQLPVVKSLRLSQIDFGAPSVYIITKKGGSIILKHPVNKNG